VVAYEGTLQISLYKDGAGLPPQGRTVRAGAALPPGGARLLFSQLLPVPRDNSRSCGCCDYVFAAPDVPVADEYECVHLPPLIVTAQLWPGGRNKLGQHRNGDPERAPSIVLLTLSYLTYTDSDHGFSPTLPDGLPGPDAPGRTISSLTRASGLCGARVTPLDLSVIKL
jgi:hypothetical protein